ncbi:MAG: hypothetical protein J2P34_08255 [Actinobacteria bacterium]|nr:hypothetical protein [Actinomycetota bacterium]
MLRLFDAQTGAVTGVVPGRPGHLRTFTAAGADQAGGLTALRACLVADLVRRVGESHGLVVTGEHAGDVSEALHRDWPALNIHPLQPSGSPPGPADVGISGGHEPAGAAGRWLAVGPVLLGDGTASADAAGAFTAALAGAGVDPLALRLALLQRAYREAAELGWEDLTAADGMVRGWREQVADWANSPSKPMCAQYTAGVSAAFDADLDTPAALRTVRALAADGEVPAGSKFESFVYLDQLLGIDLAREIGR